MSSLPPVWALPTAMLAITSISATWYSLVSEHVPKPYLDEFFHVPQAKRYCSQDFTWDPKITTPPGLYLVSLLLKPIAGCETSSLRVLNVGAIALICLVVYQILGRLRKPMSNDLDTGKPGLKQRQTPPKDWNSILDAHSALNVALFPPLFFFSALYYTDVMSTLAVLLSYYAFLIRNNTENHLRYHIWTVSVGVLALLFRQTNVFWVAVFPAGLAVVRVLGNTHKTAAQAPKNAQAIVESAWVQGRVHDIPVEDAGPQDFLLFFVTVALAALKKPLLVLTAVLPYTVILALFTAFVVWNGGVVLGDKSAHVATIHLPQMLYLWPYIVFFSVPLVLRPVLSPIVDRLPNRLGSLCKMHLTGEQGTSYPRFLSYTVFVLCGTAVVYFNTIVHPYTLADNRHYVFYAFRILLRHPAIRYLAVPIYAACYFLAIRTLDSPNADSALVKQDRKDNQPGKGNIQQQPCKISLVIVLLITTTLSVATAPLVEPRYFIIPWIMWRLHVPCISASPTRNQQEASPYDVRLILETVWLLAINAAVGYSFLYWGFTWPSEPRNVQRFLW